MQDSAVCFQAVKKWNICLFLCSGDRHTPLCNSYGAALESTCYFVSACDAHELNPTIYLQTEKIMAFNSPSQCEGAAIILSWISLCWILYKTQQGQSLCLKELTTKLLSSAENKLPTHAFISVNSHKILESWNGLIEGTLKII